MRLSGVLFSRGVCLCVCVGETVVCGGEWTEMWCRVEYRSIVLCCGVKSSLTVPLIVIVAWR